MMTSSKVKLQVSRFFRNLRETSETTTEEFTQTVVSNGPVGAVMLTTIEEDTEKQEGKM